MQGWRRDKRDIQQWEQHIIVWEIVMETNRGTAFIAARCQIKAPLGRLHTKREARGRDWLASTTIQH